MFPTVDALSEAKVHEIKKIIAPLGMENIRALGLRNLARILATKYDGKIPADRGLLLELPNVGPYTANAVMCLAFDQQVPLVDTNAVRVVTRVFSITSHRNRPYTDPVLWKIIASLIPSSDARRFNLAMLDLGSSLCLHTSPRCFECPLLELCDYGNAKVQLRI
jgi:A/G-specific adenine glycosylase